MTNHAERAKGGWLMAYGDVTTLLICFFIMMMMKNRGEISRVHDWVNQRVDETALELRQLVDRESLHTFRVQRESKGVKITLQGKELFASGRAEVGPVLQKQLKKVSQLLPQMTIFSVSEQDKYADFMQLVTNSGMDWTVEIRVEGHTDNQPLRIGAKYANNWLLSAARASSVMQVLHQQSGMPEKVFSVAGFGEYQPVAENDSPQGRERNRRIDIYINAALMNRKLGGEDG